jgi:CRISPR-associated protein Cmr1
LDFKLNTSQEDIDSIEQVLYVFGLLGGLGSRARRGFGSVSLTEFQRNKEAVKNLSYTKQQYQQVIDELLAEYQKVIEYPPYTVFSKKSLFKFITINTDARQVHNKIGLEYKNFRLGFKKSDKSKKRAFGLPLASYDENNRRSSPLFFHIHPLADNTFVGIALYLPAVFHYEKDEYKDTQTFLKPVKQFMESLK